MKKTKEVGQKSWKDTARHIFMGVGVALLLLLVELVLASVAISSGLISQPDGLEILVTGCVFATMAGAFWAVSKEKSRILPVSATVGVLLFCTLVLLGTLAYPTFSLENSGFEIFFACLCGGAVVRVLYRKKKKSR